MQVHRMSRGSARIASAVVGSACVGITCSYLWSRIKVPRAESQHLSAGSTATNQQAPYPPISSNSSMTASGGARLTQDVLDGILRDPRTTDGVVTLLKDVFTHEATLGALKQHFKWEFTENKATVGALNKFIVDDVVCDPFVAEQLIGIAKDLGKSLIEHPRVYPGASMELLGAAAMDALKTHRFEQDLTAALKEGGKYAAFFASGDDR